MFFSCSPSTLPIPLPEDRQTFPRLLSTRLTPMGSTVKIDAFRRPPYPLLSPFLPPPPSRLKIYTIRRAGSESLPSRYPATPPSSKPARSINRRQGLIAQRRRA